ncbi:uncharacterized protein LOC129611253 isoform X2 [Condylostylus longicornis]|uniref:uncharacterized protein LOC129611253 isoform X2 n=1 Tax=Condylostylus longicornis TaxID=2530218 RepID=UPI00244E3F8F|nr:uncharacterized protein LOC129611253 isoform X2 [Condylostylus longicornis]
MPKYIKFSQGTLRTLLIIFTILFYTTIFIYTITSVPSVKATSSIKKKNLEISNTAIISDLSTTTNLNDTIRQPPDNYLITNQKECLKSRNFLSCLKYRASKFIWSLATNRYKYFDSSNSRSLININKNNYNDENFNDDDDNDDDDDLSTGRNEKTYNNSIVNKKNFQMKFVYLNTPSDLELFEETRTFQGDGEISKAVKFVKRAIQTFVQHHGLQVSLDSLGGFQVSRGGKNFITEYRGHKKTRKKLKWLILFPLIILGKIASLKMSMVVLMFTVIGAQLALAGGFAFIIYWLKHTYLCKINPKWAENVSGPTWDEEKGHFRRSFNGRTYLSPKDYSSFGYPGSDSSSPFVLGNKDWASSKAYNAYNYLDTISRPI